MVIEVRLLPAVVLAALAPRALRLVSLPVEARRRQR